MQQLFELANELNKTNPLHLPTFIKKAKELNLALSYGDLRDITKEFCRFGEMVFPELVTEFIIMALQGESGHAILDPSAEIGSLITPIVQKLSFKKAYGLVHRQEQLEIARLMDESMSVSWDPRTFDEFSKNLGEPIETIVSCPPFLGQKEEVVIKFSDQTIKHKDTLVNTTILRSLFQLSQDGKGLFIVPQSFFLENNDKFRKLINEWGFYIQFAITLPANTISNTNISTNLILINREPSHRLFIAELNEIADIKPIINNWKNKKHGKIFTNGTFVDINEYRSFQATAKHHEATRLAKKMNLPAYSLKEITLEINRAQKNLEEGFIEKTNAVYLPLIGKSDAVCKISDFKMKNPDNYIQLVLDSKKALGEFVAYFFNTEIGITLRESLVTGMTIPKINKNSLQNATIYLPDIDSQHEIIKVQSNITDLRTQIKDLEHQLWKQPLGYKKIEKELRQLNKEEGFREWTESLPFPLGSILWRYVAESDIRLKKSVLIHFFEAFIQFHVMIFMSGIKNDHEFFKEHKQNLLTSEDLEYIKKASFGAWIEVGSKIAKLIRKELSNNDSQRIQKMFCQSRTEFVESITNKKIFSILNEARNIRNQDAHGGIENMKEATNKLTLLESELSKLRGILGNCYDDTYFVRHKSLDPIDDQVYKQTVELLIGTRQPFQKYEFLVKKHLIKDKLYLYHEGYAEALELIPLVKFSSSPDYEENACYFYNRIENNEIHWKSYHFDKESEKVISENSLYNWFNEFWE